MTQTELRIVLLVAGLLVLALIYFFGRPSRPWQGRRVAGRKGGARVEPRLEGEAPGEGGDLLDESAMQAELELLERTLSGQPTPPPRRVRSPGPAEPRPGARLSSDFDRIVTLYVAAREQRTMRGPDIAVAAEKAGLTFGHMNVFHRLVDGKPEQGPIFSVASMVKPGSFDMAQIGAIETPGLTFFMTLPGPVSALDAWEAMLPTAQRIAELLDASVQDEQRNTLGRQRIAHIRDELRAYDRKREQQEARTNW
ncbi:MAG TPA: cell division protein ZipA [Xanthomonadaceae bacterium]|nr:cell division protein ZipA [Xanthomonadaceae bacterium]